MERARDTYHTYKQERERNIMGTYGGQVTYVPATRMGPLSEAPYQVRP